MFGTYRTILALFVVLSHLGGIPGFGGYAVFGFYTLSGYLMTLILQKNYGYAPSGMAKYALNRFLRIVPPYWVACLVSAGLVLWLGRDATTDFHKSIFLPTDAEAVLRHVFIIFDHRLDPRLVPPAWALTIELFFYAVIGLGLSRTRPVTSLWFFASVGYTVFINLRGEDFASRYYTLAACSLPFSTGAMLFHFRREIASTLRFLSHAIVPALLLSFILLNLFVASKYNVLHTVGFYLNYLLNALLIAALAERAVLPGISKPLDTRLGDLSYPIYLLHYQAGLLMLGTGGLSFTRDNPLFALICLPLLLVMAWALAQSIERPMEAIRSRIKGRSRTAPPASTPSPLPTVSQGK